MQENVRFFDAELHKNVYFLVSKVHKIAKSVISMMSKGLSKNSEQVITCIKVGHNKDKKPISTKSKEKRYE